MNLHEALKTALSREIQIRDHYAQGAKAIQDPKGRKVFETLAKEEQGHVDYLEHRLWEFEKSGKVESPELGTVLPTRKQLKDEAVTGLHRTGPAHVAAKAELELVKLALELEEKTGAMYRELVATLPEADRKMFGRFLDIEDGHLAIVQAELDSLTGLGYWFDVAEFSLEAM